MKNYIKYLRRQSKHIQHAHAAVFAGTITAIIAVFILYYDYGFWHEEYVRGSFGDTSASSSVVTQTPMESFGRFLSEARERLGGIKDTTGSFFEGRETYTK
jgi:hypothetical protein